jgi:2-octaprenylphenol hydroxylase
MRGMSVTALEKHHGMTTVICSDDTKLSAPLIIAADGGQSKIRELANLNTREWDYQHKAIVATVESSQSHQFTAWQNFLVSGPLAFLPLDHESENYCSIVWSLDSEKADAVMALNDDDFSTALARAFESRLGRVVSVSPRYCFPLQQRHAIDYSSDNIVLIGDAAHTIHPLAGQGVNLGLLDAQALAAEIKRAVVRDLPLSEPSILRRYQRQRKANNLEVMLLMEGFKRLFGSKKLLLRYLRNMGLRKVNGLKALKNWLTKKAINKL